MSAAVISVEDLTKTFPAARGLGALIWPKRSAPVEALRGANLEVPRGRICGLLGPNGAGKTTLMEILATYLLPTRGRVRIDGHDASREPIAVRRAVGYCSAGARGLDHRLTGRQNLEFFALLHRLPRSRAREQVERLWKLVGLDGFEDGPVAGYSDGMGQRLALARALLDDPPVLLLDEPMRGLDPSASAFWTRLLRERLAREEGRTILLVTHDPHHAEEICDRAAILEGGRIVAEGPPREVLLRDWFRSRASAVCGERSAS